MEIGAKTRARLVLLGAIPVVGCGVVGCADHGGRSAEVSSSSASSLSSVSSDGVSSDAPTLRPSLDAGGESGSSAAAGAGGGSGVQAGQDVSSGSGHHIANPDQVGGHCGTTSDGDEIVADGRTSCGFAGAIFTSAMQQQFQKWAPDPTVTPVYRADFTQTSPTTGKNYTVVCIIGTAQTTLSCSEKINATGSEYGSFSVSYEHGPAGIYGPRVAKK